jgi:hypothetical protein
LDFTFHIMIALPSKTRDQFDTPGIFNNVGNIGVRVKCCVVACAVHARSLEHVVARAIAQHHMGQLGGPHQCCRHDVILNESRPTLDKGNNAANVDNHLASTV